MSLSRHHCLSDRPLLRHCMTTLIETAGGGVEEGEDLVAAIKRELKEELGIMVEIICKIGVVSDYYNLIHRHNINNYFLCKVESFGEKELTEDEINSFHLSTLKLSYEEAVKEYKYRANTRLGKKYNGNGAYPQ